MAQLRAERIGWGWRETAARRWDELGGNGGRAESEREKKSERGRGARWKGEDKRAASDQVECPSDNGVHAATVYGRRQRRASE